MTACNCNVKCPHDGTIIKHDAAIDQLAKVLAEMRADLKDVKNVVHALGTMQVESAHVKESLGRAFARIDALEREKAHDDEVSALAVRVKELEKARESYDAFINQVHGMKHLAWALWSILAGGLGVVLFKVFQIVH